MSKPCYQLTKIEGDIMNLIVTLTGKYLEHFQLSMVEFFYEVTTILRPTTG